VIFQDFLGHGIFKKKIQDFPGGVGTLTETVHSRPSTQSITALPAPTARVRVKVRVRVVIVNLVSGIFVLKTIHSLEHSFP